MQTNKTTVEIALIGSDHGNPGPNFITVLFYDGYVFSLITRRCQMQGSLISKIDN